ncbi:MAG: hypothetical protein WAU01_10735 [Saprospiraceae bacterium]
MKSKLSKFTDFAQCVLPLEADFLYHFQKFEDDEKKSILQSIVDLAKSRNTEGNFDQTIDKRKYSYVKRWCEQLLIHLDVDKNMEKLLNWEMLIMTDSIALRDERDLLKLIQNTDPSDFNFIKIYDISRTYRHYLQIRLRYKDYQLVNQFQTEFRTDYEFSKLVNDKLHETTNDIISDYSRKKSVNYTDSFPWLSSLFYNEKLDGYNRILAWIRMVFIAHNMKKYDLLRDMFVYFEKQVSDGKFYSRRIVTNFYSQYLLYYSAHQDFEKAAYYGYLSIKEKNNDYLYYVNNLAAVLLRGGRSDDALHILRESASVAKTSVNYHNKIGHAAFILFSLIDSGNAKQAENHGFVFLTAFKKEIFEHRWHLFFNAYIKAMLINGNYSEVVKVYSTFRLADKDDIYKKSANYSPTIPWMFHLASFKHGDITFAQLKTLLQSLVVKDGDLNPNMVSEDLVTIAKIVLKGQFGKLDV